MAQGTGAFVVRTSPHVHSGARADVIMRNVVWSLLPVCAFSVYQFGLSAAALLAVCAASCVGTEHLVCRLSRRTTTVNDWSAVITGLLLGLTLPPGLPLWMAAVGGIFGVAAGKLVFGGLGYNAFNPALVGRAFLQASFPVAMTTWHPTQWADRFSGFLPGTLTPPLLAPLPVDGMSAATPLALWKFDGMGTPTRDLLLGMSPGSAGELPALLILACGAYLVYRGMMNWRLPAGMLAGAGALSLALWLWNSGLYPTPWFTLCSGGLMLGAVFMASDMVASPLTSRGVWIYAGFMGITTVVIRTWGGLPEGVMYAILLGNALSPLIDNATQPKPHGRRGRKAA